MSSARSLAATCNSLLKRWPWRSSLILNAVLLALTLLLLTPRFLWNDDPMMMLLAAGVGRVGDSTGKLVFTHIAIGTLLKGLYSLSLDIPWYGMYLLACLYTAHSVFAYCLLRLRPALAGCSLFLFYFVSIGFYFVCNLQFTIASILVSAAGYSLLLVGTREQLGEVAGRWRNALSPGACAAIALILLGAMIREQAVLLAFALVAPLILLVRRPSGSGVAQPRPVLAAVAFLSSLGLSSLNRVAYAEESYGGDLYEWNALATDFLDNGAFSRAAAGDVARLVQESGWSPNDCQLFLSWFYLNQSLYDVESFRAILAGLPDRNVHLTRKVVLEELLVVFEGSWARNCLAVFFLAGLAFFDDLRSVLIAALTLGVALGAFVYLIYFKKPPPDRVFLPALAFVALIPCLASIGGRTLADRLRSPLRRIAFALGCLGAIVQAASALGGVREQSEANERAQEWVAEALVELSRGPAQVHVAFTGAVPWELLDPLGSVAYLQDLLVLDSRPFPSTVKTLAAWGIEDVHLALARDERISLIVPRVDGRRKLALFSRYMIEHHETYVEFRPVLANAAFSVYSPSVVTQGVSGDG